MFAADQPIDTKPCDCKGVTPCQCEDCKCEKPAQSKPELPNRMLMFTATWCGPCQMWKRDEKPALDKVGWTINYSDTADIQYIDYDRQQDMVRKYRVTSWPTFIMVKPDGTEIVRYGYLDANQTADIWNDNQSEAGQ